MNRTYIFIAKPFNATMQKTGLANRNCYISLYFKIKIRLFAISGCHYGVATAAAAAASHC